MLVGVFTSSTSLSPSGADRFSFNSSAPKLPSFSKPLISNVCAFACVSVTANFTYIFGATFIPSTIAAISVSSADAYVSISGAAS